MTDIEQKYAVLGLNEENRTRLVQLGQLATLPTVEYRRIVVETVVIQDGGRVVIEKEEHSA